MVKIEIVLEEKEKGNVSMTRKLKDKASTDNEKIATTTILEIFTRSVEDYSKKI